jgi:hypothetical protein
MGTGYGAGLRASLRDAFAGLWFYRHLQQLFRTDDFVWLAR